MNNDLWHPDIKITDSFVENIIAKQFPELLPMKIKYIGEGWDNKVFLVNNQFMFRFPHREIAALLIKRENTVLGHLHRIIDLAIPQPIYLGQPDETYPYHFHGYAMIQGESGCQANLSDIARNESITTLASFLKALHSINESQAREIGAEDQCFNRADIKKSITFLKDRVEKITNRKLAIINNTLFNHELDIATHVKLSGHKVLVHGDLYCRHLIFKHNKLAGIIDWGDVGINHPAIDLAVIFSFYPAHCHQTFFKIYGEIDLHTKAYARFLGLYSTITIFLYGHDINDPQLINEALASIQRINPKLMEFSHDK